MDIHPTPVVGTLGLVDELRRPPPGIGWSEGDSVVLLGRATCRRRATVSYGPDRPAHGCATPGRQSLGGGGPWERRGIARPLDLPAHERVTALVRDLVAQTVAGGEGLPQRGPRRVVGRLGGGTRRVRRPERHRVRGPRGRGSRRALLRGTAADRRGNRATGRGARRRPARQRCPQRSSARWGASVSGWAPWRRIVDAGRGAGGPRDRRGPWPVAGRLASSPGGRRSRTTAAGLSRVRRCVVRRSARPRVGSRRRREPSDHQVPVPTARSGLAAPWWSEPPVGTRS